MKNSLLILAISLGLTACGSGGVKTNVSSSVPTPVVESVTVPDPASEVRAPADWDSKSEAESWTNSLAMSLEAYGQGLLATTSVKDAKKYCPKYSSLSRDQRKAFYIMLISSMARFESSFKPETTYTEDFKDSQGLWVKSRGLLQISKESANQSAYGCKIVDKEDLHLPAVNLACGVKILNYWIKKDGYVGTYLSKTQIYGGARYWSVLRDISGSNSKIAAKTKALPYCQ